MTGLKIIVIVVVSFIGSVRKSFAQELNTYRIISTKIIEANGKKFTVQNGEFQVPEDRNKQHSRILKLPVQIVKAINKYPAESIFLLDGGPGVANIRAAKRIISSSESLLANHDIVCIGYRGVDVSTVLKSKKINKAFKSLHKPLLSNESLDKIESYMNAYAIQLQQQQTSSNCYTIPEVIEDIEYARKLLGYKRIQLLTVSYGTRVALLYSYMHPEVLFRTVMIGPNPPGHFIWQPEKTEQILGLYDSMYKSWNHSEVSLKQVMIKALKRMPKRWSLYRLNADKIKMGTFCTLYSKENAVLAFNMYLKAANKGDYSGLYLIQKIYDMSITGRATGEMFAKAFSVDYNPAEYYRNTMEGANTVLGGNMSLLLWGVAKGWTMQRIPEAYRKAKSTNAETLVIGGDLDVSTPADFARTELMPFLPKGQYLELKNMSHSDIFYKAIRHPDFLATYFDSGIVNKSVIDTPEIVDFSANKKFGKMKILVLGLIK